MNRRGFQKLADLRLKEAKCLLQASLYDGAYYLAGYVIECALKACVAKQTRKYDFPDKKIVNKSYTHNLDELVDVAGLRTQLNQKMQTDNAFEANWTLVKDWSEDARYRRHSKVQSNDFVRAVSDPHSGILEWLREHW